MKGRQLATATVITALILVPVTAVCVAVLLTSDPAQGANIGAGQLLLALSLLGTGASGYISHRMGHSIEATILAPALVTIGLGMVGLVLVPLKAKVDLGFAVAFLVGFNVGSAALGRWLALKQIARGERDRQTRS